MAINLDDANSLRKLQRAVEYNYEQSASERDTRKDLIEIFRGKGEWPHVRNDAPGTPVNYFQAFVRGHLLSVAHQLPKWGVKPRTLNARGFANTARVFLNSYNEKANLAKVFRQTAIDSAFGNAIIKVVNGPPPKGIHSVVAPRAYRISPNNMIMDLSATEPDEALFIADTYLVSLSEAQNYEGFDPQMRAQLKPWTESGGQDMLPERYNDTDVLAEDMTRLIDVYLPRTQQIVTWAANSQGFKFAEIATERPLAVGTTPINPYCILQLLTLPETLEEISHLESLKELHLISNDGYAKAAKQMRQSKRNPTGNFGDEQAMDDMLAKGEGEGVMLEQDTQLNVFALPGPDPSIIQTAAMFGGLFSQHAGNLDVALGQSAGADTARQTQALLGQIGSAQALDRLAFEMFMAEVGKKVLTLAYENEALELHTMEQVPGTEFVYPVSWLPPAKQPRVAGVGDFLVDVVPFSSAYRPPEARLQQLQQASQMALQWMMASTQGIPVNMQAIIRDLEETFDLVGNITEWFTPPPEPTPAQKTQQHYMGTPGAHEGTRVQYSSDASGSGGGGGGGGFAEPASGFQQPTGV